MKTNPKSLRAQAIKKAKAGRLTLDADELAAEKEMDKATSLGAARVAQVRERIEASRDQTKSERVNARFPTSDIEALRKLAAREGVPYQTLLGSVLHKYVTGQLVDVDAARLALEALVKKRA